MLKKFVRWPILLIFAALLIAALVPVFPLLHQGDASKARAAGTPTITLSTNIVRPEQVVTATAQGFASHDVVNLQLDTPSYTFATLYCDSNGNCSDTVSMAAINVVQGQHTLIAVGKKLRAETIVTYIPDLAVLTASGAKPKGGPGTPVQVYGAAFTANEAVKVYWGKPGGLLEGDVHTDGYGNLNIAFTIPAGTTPGLYPINVVRSQQTPERLIGWFHVMPPLITSYSKVHGTAGVEVYVSGFQAGEQVAISWNANGGQQLGTLTTDSTGSGYTAFILPSAGQGSHTLNATGDSSGIQATTSITVGPGITLNPANDEVPGGIVSVIGAGFTPGETINVHMQYEKKVAASGIVAGDGSFAIPLTLPIHYDVKSNFFYIYASNATGTEHAKASFSFANPWIGTNIFEPVYGNPITFTGQGFVPGETVDIFWNYQQQGQIKAGSAVAASDGTFTATFAVPSDPNLDRTHIEAIGEISQLRYDLYLVEQPALVLLPPIGHTGTRLHILGGGFNADEAVTVTFKGTTIATLTADRKGAIAKEFDVPQLVGPGDAPVQAVGSVSGITISSIFAYTPTLEMTPTTGPSGTTITVTGHHFSANWGIDLYWLDPDSGTRTYLTDPWADSQGFFTQNVAIPMGLTGGKTYDLQAVDRYTNVTLQLPFVAQGACVQCLQLTPDLALPGSTITVQGSGFTAGEAVNVYFQQTSNGIVPAQVGSDGTFTTSLTVPRTYVQGTTYYVYAVSTTGTDHASAQFLFVQPQLWSADPYDSPAYASTWNFVGSGFAPDEIVNFFWNYGHSHIWKANSASTDSSGGVTIALKIPSIPFNTSIKLIAQGATSKAMASTPVDETVALLSSATYGYPGAKVYLNGGGFGANEAVTLELNGSTTLATLNTDANGHFASTVVIAASSAPGEQTFTAIGSSGSMYDIASASFLVLPKVSINPASGPSGAQITVTGRFFTINGSVAIWFYDPSTNRIYLLDSPVASPTGTLKTIVTIPSDLVSGNTYYFQIYDQSTGVSVQLPFLAQ